MPSQNCGNCNFQGDHGPKRIYCYYWLEWKVKNENDCCDKFQEFAEQNKEIRLRLAEEKRRQDKELQKSDSMTRNDKLFSAVFLEKEQQDLLCIIVEASRNLPPEKRQEFTVVYDSSISYSFLQHPGLHENEIKFYSTDLEFLSEQGFIYVLSSCQYGIVRFDVHPKGLQYYLYIKEKSGEPVEKIEKTVHSYIDTQDFQKEYSKAYEKWAEAEHLLWETEAPNQLTTIGHLCREAIQEFMDILYIQLSSPDKSIPKDKTINRLRKIIEAKSQQLGETERNFLKGLHKYWDVMNDLIQKQEHGSQRENAQLILKDGRRVVFQTMVLMYEVSQSLR